MLLFFGVWKLKKCQVQRCGFEEWQSSTWRNVAIGSGKLFFLGNLCLIRSCILVILVVFQRGKRNKGSEHINSQAYHLQLTQELFSTMSCQVESYWWRRSKSRNLSLPWYPVSNICYEVRSEQYWFITFHIFPLGLWMCFGTEGTCSITATTKALSDAFWLFTLWLLEP